MSRSYLEKNALFPKLIDAPVEDNLGLTVVIPCYDEPQLIRSLESLKKCAAPTCSVEVIVIINDGELETAAVKARNQATFETAKSWAAQNSSSFLDNVTNPSARQATRLQFHILYKTNLPKKIAGVGTARKIGMDEAVRRLLSVEKSDGVIACFDADSLCEENYFQALENHFSQNPKTQTCGIYFEHPLHGTEYAPEVYTAITKYELYLRYYVHAQQYAGFPWATQTIGSSMAVRVDAYQQQGGMNKRKAGEDFYFIHKFTPLNAHTLIKDTTVIPSPRQSHRVPFGTGKAVNDILEKNNLEVSAENTETEAIEYWTYNFKIFEDLKAFLEVAPNLLLFKKEQVELMKQNLPESILTFLNQHNFDKKLAEIQANTTVPITFGQRFFRWFNAFFLMKFVHFARDNYYPNVRVEDAAIALLQKYYFLDKKGKSAEELLMEFRKRDKSVF